MHITGISIYPVKSLRGLSVDQAVVEPWGLAGDRLFLVVDPQGRFLTQRQCPGMAEIDAKPTPDGITLQHAGRPPLRVPAPPADPEPTPVTVWRDRVAALPVGSAADRWLAAVLGRPCRLMVMADPARDRPVDPAFGRAEDRVSFADGFPLLATSQTSLDDLNGRLAAPVGMDRFRPNLVVAGAPAWAEDGWTRVQIGPVTFEMVKPCTRCIVTTTDQRTGVRDPALEPIRTLQRFRRNAAGLAVFGQNLVPRSRGTVTVGDPVVVLAG